MSHTSPASYLVWALLSCMLGVFLVYHLYSFDRFKCLKWNNGPYSGAFKRIMTYSYLFSIPLIITYSVGFSAIKYREGYVSILLVGVTPKPYPLWSSASRACIFPLTLCFSLAWSLEMVTHLEELCFWLFVVNAKTNQQDWFHSHYFKMWIVGSVSAVIYMPLVTIFTRESPYKSEACTFLAGSLGSLSLTVGFMPVLWAFPSMLNNLRAEGVDSGTIVRLTKFHELNTVRVIFRYLFTVPLLILGADGIRPHQHINDSNFWTDLFTFVAALGCTISSGITLIIFFPRSVENEIATRDAAKRRKQLRKIGAQFAVSMSSSREAITSTKMQGTLHGQEYELDPRAIDLTSRSDDFEHDATGISQIQQQQSQPIRPNRKHGSVVELGGIGAPPPRYETPKTPSIQPNRRRDEDVELGSFSSPRSHRKSLPETVLSGASRNTVNPLIHAYTSPINMVYTASAKSRRTSGHSLPSEP